MKRKFFKIIGPGILVAATGIGAGDLATAAFAGSKLGVGILWVVIVGAFFKFVLTEGLTRWQLATGKTIIEGAATNFGRPLQYAFMIYLLIWTFLVAAALMSACGVAAQAIFPLFQDPATGKIVYGMIFSIIGLVLVRAGGYELFEKVMNISIGLMFVTVVTTAILLYPNWSEIISGIFLPDMSQISGEGLAWSVALMGGVGGTVTILCYGYWIREEKRFDDDDLRDSRLDLAVAYVVTAVFGLAMVVIGSTVEVEGRGASLIIKLADRLVNNLGIPGKWIFLLGAFGAIFSSLLGVWQSIPYLFADLWGQLTGTQATKVRKVDTNSKPYRFYLYGMTFIPMVGLWIGFASMQKFYAIFGAIFIPILAVVLLILNGRVKFIGKSYMNHRPTTAVLILILLFFLIVVWLTFQTLLQ